MWHSRWSILKRDDRGTALISVLVITTFISAIATIMLYMAAVNYQQKQTDYQNKKSFYGAEKALDELKSILVKDVQDAYVTAYNETVKNFLWNEGGLDPSGYYQTAFIEALDEIWEARKDAISPAEVNAMPVFATMNDDQKAVLLAVQGLLKSKSSLNGTEYADNAECFYKIEGYGVYKDSNGTDDARKYVLKGIQVKRTEGNYTTFLYTDICLEPPSMNWVESFSTMTDETTPEEAKIESIAFTDYVYYINWHRADYDERNNYKTEIGEEEKLSW